MLCFAGNSFVPRGTIQEMMRVAFDFSSKNVLAMFHVEHSKWFAENNGVAIW